MSDPVDPRRLAIPAPAPDPNGSLDPWEDEDGPAIIEDEAPPITHWDLLSEERIPAVAAPPGPPLRPRPSGPFPRDARPAPLRLPPSGGVFPDTRPSAMALPLRGPEPSVLAPEDVPEPESLGRIRAISEEDEAEFFDGGDSDLVDAASLGAGWRDEVDSEQIEARILAELDEEDEEDEDEDVEESASPPAPLTPSPEALERLLAAPSAESLARMPAIGFAAPPSGERAPAPSPPAARPSEPPAPPSAAAPSAPAAVAPPTPSADQAEPTPDDSLRAWARRTSSRRGVDTQPVRSTREEPEVAPAPRKAPALQFATGSLGAPAITFAEEPLPGPVPGTAHPDPLQERVNELIGETVNLIVDPPAEPDGEAPMALPARYRWLANLGEGGQGRVELVFDRDLGRQVALKTLHATKNQERHLLEFYAEARITGQLEHPNIMPVYDAGQLPDGRLYYTMRRMPGENLHNVLSRLRRGDAEMMRRWALPDLIRVLRQACLGVGYAHDRNVLHRDLKPANILLGTHGEVLVVDWGIARLVPGEDGGVTDSIRRRAWSESRDARRERVRGSPPYMAPEQVKHPDQVGAAADVFCLGVILYEILTRVPPFAGKEVEDVVEALCHERPLPPRERAPDLAVPAELEEICLRCLEKFPGHRYPSATGLADALGSWQSGARRRDAAARRLRDADGMRTRYQSLLTQKRAATAELQAALGPIGRPPETGSPLRGLQDQAQSLERAADGVFSEAVWALHRALGDDPENPVAQAQLAELYSERYTEAERLGLDREKAYFRALLRQFGDGRWGRWLRAGAELSVEVLPPETRLTLHRVDEVDGRLQLGEQLAPEESGTWSLAPGRYALTREGAASWHYPVALRRNERSKLRLDLRDEEHSGERFCFVPGGETLLGGDPLAPGGSPERHLSLPRFAIARHPVSVGAYARFLGWLQRADSAEARARTPDDWSQQSRDGETRPVVGLSLADARRYCRWLTDLTGVTIRLPSSDEWEKAVRGPDGRAWPWGDRFQAGAAATLHSCDPAQPLPAPGSFPLDRSPFGVEDGAGLVWEWTDTVERDHAVLRGGSVLDEEYGTRVAARRAIPPNRRLPRLGFRVVRQLEE